MRPLCADPSLAALPRRLSIFGLTRLPASYLEVLRSLAAHRDVHLFFLHPSPALWARIAGATTAAAGRRAADPTADLPRHPLLASWSRDACEMQLVLALGGDHPPAVDRHLSRLRRRPPAGDPAATHPARHPGQRGPARRIPPRPARATPRARPLRPQPRSMHAMGAVTVTVSKWPPSRSIEEAMFVVDDLPFPQETNHARRVSRLDGHDERRRHRSTIEPIVVDALDGSSPRNHAGSPCPSFAFSWCRNFPAPSPR